MRVRQSFSFQTSKDVNQMTLGYTDRLWCAARDGRRTDV